MIPPDLWRPIASVLAVPYSVWLLAGLARAVWERVR